ncbi:MAG: HAD-IIA family hydrolase [Fimbriimonadaceae bacterium]|nr:HAD-IIA family hydrolase [Fimbriimonadaceae bacterium]
MGFDAVLFDLDGTLYRGETAIPHAPETVRELVQLGVRVGYVTNNSTRTRVQFAEKLCALGFPAEPEQTFGTAYGVARYVRSIGVKTVYVVGEAGLVQTLCEHEVYVGEAGDRVDAVIVGLDREFHYRRLEAAMAHIRAGSQYVATNADTTYPLDGGQLIPGAGSIVAAVTAASGVEPHVIGKPNPDLIQLAMQSLGVEPSRTLVVGDRMDTDIEAGRRAGCPVHLVLCGVTPTAVPGVPSSDDVRGVLDRL